MDEGTRHGLGSVIATLELLGFRRRTGKIQVIGNGDGFGFYLEAGRIMLATSSRRTLRLGQLLLQRGAVAPLSLHDVLDTRRSIAHHQALGRVLVRSGAVTRANLAAGLEEQCVEIMAGVFDLDRATFVFVPDDPVPTEIEIVPLETDRIVAAATAQHDRRAALRLLDRLLPEPATRLALAVRLALVSFTLTDPELLVALAVDRGTATLDGLAASLPLDDLTLRRTVLSLLERGFLVTGHRLFDVYR